MIASILFNFIFFVLLFEGIHWADTSYMWGTYFLFHLQLFKLLDFLDGFKMYINWFVQGLFSRKDDYSDQAASCRVKVR